jgi:hypothetical protein
VSDDNLRRLRQEQFFSQAELARRAKLHPLTVSRLGGTTAPATRTVRALSGVLRRRAGRARTPQEVAEVRRGLAEPAQPDNDVSDRLESWNDDGRATIDPKEVAAWTS